ncbi:TonB family protein [Dysgonomonas sp. PFB1-18]|uniref:energy transducer TonB n=1 Tax=unclassified Dysgonomonas TaxID=2630389 RepID=UPI002472FE34|nr:MULTISPECIES: energy transducer TonB [unclassified Dysgonomonas]MDH6307097.1 TonB family protein [Dysgonomonas sp. PF1-14]MDH6337016.1 TonB family protein [Dysgonomonas sp. PF1-16]MDH6381002.1 TonB family protein [Dysgonomonas sp. PFB1-18]MDH6396419.1 TonB family protein [Dysgonomonas sp. PF1-23]
MKHINTLFLLLLVSLNCFGQSNISYKPLQEIDILKEDPSLSEIVGLICNVETDWGKLGLRDQVEFVTEKVISSDETLKETKFVFDDNGKIARMIVDNTKKKYIYTKDGNLKQELNHLNLVHYEYDYKKNRLTDAEYGTDGVVLQYGNKTSVNISYYPDGLVKEVFFIDKPMTVNYRYDDNKQLIEKYYSYDKGDKHIAVNTHMEYNDKNDIKQKFTSHIVSGEQADTTYTVETHAYKYDEKNNWTECIYAGNGQIITIKREINYYTDEIPEDRIYTMEEVTIHPQYKEKESELQRFIAMNLKYPINAMKHKIEGEVCTRFIISETGDVSDFQVIQEAHSSLNREALRITKLIPKKWTPAKINGKNVKVYYTLPISFRMM